MLCPQRSRSSTNGARTGQLAAGLSIAFASMCCCGRPSAPEARADGVSGDFTDCNSGHSLRLMRSCRRLLVQPDGTFDLTVHREDLAPDQIRGRWRAARDGCVTLEPAAPPASHPHLSVEPAIERPGAGLEELCATDPQLCRQVPLDVALGWADRRQLFLQMDANYSCRRPPGSSLTRAVVVHV
jgi:hypothetical protein